MIMASHSKSLLYDLMCIIYIRYQHCAFLCGQNILGIWRYERTNYEICCFLLQVIYDKISGRSRGFGFVTMSSMEEVQAAVEQFNGYVSMIILTLKFRFIRFLIPGWAHSKF